MHWCYSVRDWLGLFVASIVVCCRGSASAIGRVTVTDAFWDYETIDVHRGDNVTLTCRLQLGDNLGGLIGRPPIFRVVHSHADRTLLLTDNDNISPSFARLGRYDVTYIPPPPDGSGGSEEATAQVVLRINGVQGEDTGTLACQQLHNDEYLGYCDINVHVDVDEVYFTSISSSTGEAIRIPDGNDVILNESVNKSASSFSGGFGCVALIHRGGYRTSPPLVAVAVLGDQDEINATSWFQLTTDSVQTVTSSGLSVYRVETRLAFVIDRPDAELNGRTIRCIADPTGLNEAAKVATARLIVQYIPAISCPKFNITVSLGSNFKLTCTVKSNPESEITWSSIAQSDEEYDVNKDRSVRLVIKAVSDDEADISISVRNVQLHHLRLYTLKAVNVMGEITSAIRLIRDVEAVTVVKQTPETTTTATTTTTTITTTTTTTTKALKVEKEELRLATAPPTTASTRRPQEDIAESKPKKKIDVDTTRDRQLSMQNDGAVELGHDSHHSSLLGQRNGILNNTATPVRSENVKSAVSSADNPSERITKHLVTNLFIILTLRQLTSNGFVGKA